MQNTPIESLLGNEGDPIECKVLSDEIAMHWFNPNAKVGDTCLCGKTIKKENDAR